MKKCKPLISVILIVLLLLSAFPMSAAAEDTNIAPVGSSIPEVDIYGVPVAVAGKRAYDNPPDVYVHSQDYTLTKRTWQLMISPEIYVDVAGSFIAGQTYVPRYVLTPTAGNSFGDNVFARCHDLADLFTPESDGSLVVLGKPVYAVNYPDGALGTVSDIKLSGIVPFIGYYPNYDLRTYGENDAKPHCYVDQHNGSDNWVRGIRWGVVEGAYLSPDQRFEEGKNYFVEIMVAADYGYFFADEASITASVNDKDAASVERISDKLVCIRCAFACRADAYIVGDTDLDDTLTIIDATYIQRSLVDLYKLTFEERIAADADEDGGITILDATAIQRHIAGLPCDAKNIGKTDSFLKG